MKPLPPRLEREFKTIEKMIELYCRDHHGEQDRKDGALCEACADLLRYARKRLEFCPFHEKKPACAKCPIHCYAPRRRLVVKEVMRYSGPRMLLRHPVLAILHQLDNLREVPPVPPRRREAGGTRPGNEKKDNDSEIEPKEPLSN